jgi:hypothetical protein
MNIKFQFYLKIFLISKKLEEEIWWRKFYVEKDETKNIKDVKSESKTPKLVKISLIIII